MKKFTKLWQLMMILMLTSSVAFAQKSVTVQDALKNVTVGQKMKQKEKVLQEEQQAKTQDVISKEMVVAEEESAINGTQNVKQAFDKKAPVLSPIKMKSVKKYNSPKTVFYSQMTAGTNAGASQDFDATYDVYDCEAADDFTVTGGPWNVQRISWLGTATSSIGGFNITFYNDNAGSIGTVFASYPDNFTTTDGAGLYTSYLPSPMAFPDGTYWIEIQARWDFGTYGQFFWTMSNDTTPTFPPYGNEALWENPGDGFGTGYTTWTGVNTVWPPFQDMTFELSDDPPPPCVPVSSPWVAGYTTTSATLGWTENGTATNWEIRLDTAGFDTTGVTPVAAGSNPFVYTGLQQGWTYDWYVRANCGGGDYSSWIGPITLRLPDYFGAITPGATCQTDGEHGFSEFSSAWYEVTMSDTKYYNFSVCGLDNCAGDFFNLVDSTGDGDFTLYDVDGYTELWYVDGASVCDWNASTYGQPVESWNPPAAGTYYLKVNDWADRAAKFTLAYRASTCPEPTALTATNITGTTADLGWTELGSATSWDIELGPTGFAPTGTPTASGVTNPYTYTGLTSYTTYDYYVRSVCSAFSTSIWVGPYTFTTACGVLPAPIFEGFESGSFPACWSQESGDDFDWTVYSGSTTSSNTGPSSAYEGTYYIYCETSSPVTNGNVATFYSPEIDLSTLSVPQLSFYYHMYGAGMDPDGSISAAISADGGATWTTLFNEVGNHGDVWNYAAIDLSAYSGTVIFSFTGQVSSTGTSYQNDFALDAISIDETPACPDPLALGATNITSSSADLTWTSNSGLSDIELGLAGFTPSGTPTDPGVTSPYTVSGLTDNTSYDYYVRDDCGGGVYSNWVGPYTFTTKCGTLTAPYFEDFAVWPPDCIDLTGGTYSWVQYTATGVECAEASFWGQTSGNTDIMTTTTIDISGLTNPGLWFDWSHSYSTSYPGDTLFVKVSDDTGASWTDVWVKGGADLESNDGAGNTTPGSFASSGYIDLSTFTSPVMVQFYALSGYGPDLFVDNLTIDEIPQCPDPYALGYANPTTTTVDLTWTSNSGLSDIIWGPMGFDPNVTGTYVLSVTSPYTLTGLNIATGYDFYVRDDCGGGTISNWAGPQTFYTTPVNDDCADAEFVTGPYPQTVSGTTTGATVDCPGVLDWNAVWYEIDLPYEYNIVDIGLCLDDAALTLNNTGIILTADCSCDPNSFIYSTGTWSVAANCIDSLVFVVQGPGTVFYPVIVDPMGDFTFDVNVLQAPFYTVSGNVTYANAAMTPMDYISVSLDTNGVSVQNTYTDAVGDYAFNWVVDGNYSLTSATTKPRGGTEVGDINLVINHILGSSLTGIQFTSADVTADAIVNVNDLNGLVNEILGVSTGWAAPDWIFEDPSFTVAGSSIVVDYQALCSGDPNGTYTPPTSLPPWCDAGAGTCDEFIDSVAVGTINNGSTGCGNANGYSDFTGLSTDLTQGAMGVSITVVNGNPYLSDDLGVWIDWNQDGDFDDAGENVVCDVDNGGEGTFTFDVPATATLGQTRMRVRIKWSGSDCGSSCGSTTYGEVEDYSVNVIP